MSIAFVVHVGAALSSLYEVAVKHVVPTRLVKFMCKCGFYVCVSSACVRLYTCRPAA